MRLDFSSKLSVTEALLYLELV